jgi:hypothetical protein
VWVGSVRNQSLGSELLTAHHRLTDWYYAPVEPPVGAHSGASLKVSLWAAYPIPLLCHMKSRDLKRVCYLPVLGIVSNTKWRLYLRRSQPASPITTRMNNKTTNCRLTVPQTHSRCLKIQQYLGHSSSGPIAAHAESAVAKSTHSTVFPSLSWSRCGSDQHLGWSPSLYSIPALALYLVVFRTLSGSPTLALCLHRPLEVALTAAISSADPDLSRIVFLTACPGAV